MRSSLKVKAQKEVRVKNDEYLKAIDANEYRGMMLGPTGEAALEAYAKMLEENAAQGNNTAVEDIKNIFARTVKVENAKQTLDQLKSCITEKMLNAMHGFDVDIPEILNQQGVKMESLSDQVTNLVSGIKGNVESAVATAVIPKLN